MQLLIRNAVVFGLCLYLSAGATSGHAMGSSQPKPTPSPSPSASPILTPPASVVLKGGYYFRFPSNTSGDDGDSACVREIECATTSSGEVIVMTYVSNPESRSYCQSEGFSEVYHCKSSNPNICLAPGSGAYGSSEYYHFLFKLEDGNVLRRQLYCPKDFKDVAQCENKGNEPDSKWSHWRTYFDVPAVHFSSSVKSVQESLSLDKNCENARGFAIESAMKFCKDYRDGFYQKCVLAHEEKSSPARDSNWIPRYYGCQVKVTVDGVNPK